MRRPSAGFWCTTPQSVRASSRCRARPSADTSCNWPSRWRNCTKPASGALRAAIASSSVDLPQPDSPPTPPTPPPHTSKQTPPPPGPPPAGPPGERNHPPPPRPRRSICGCRARSTRRRSCAFLRGGGGRPAFPVRLAFLAFLAFLALSALLAVVRIGAGVHARALVVGDDFIEKAVGRAAQRAGGILALYLERVVFKAQALHRRVRRHGINALFAARAKQLQCGVHVHLGVVELRDR